MKNPLSGLFRARDKPRDAVSPAEVFYFGSSVSGKTVNPRNTVQVSTVYACVRVIAETIASLPVSVYEDTGSGSRKATEHPLHRLLHDEPNAEMTSFVWRETMLSHLLLWGNSYSQIVRSGKTNILSLYPLLPDRMEVDRDSKGNLTYLADINEQAMKMMFRLVEQMADKEGVTEQLKAKNPMLWIGRMNEIQAKAREIVNAEIIYA